MTRAIAQRIETVRPENPQGQPLTVVPICGPSFSEPAYRLLEPSTQDKVLVTEVTSQGHVPELKVENRLDVMVYLLDGQELRGAKQNRILNTDVLVRAGQTITIPVSCVEQGRWRSVSSAFSPGKTASYRTRSGKSGRVHESLKQAGRHDADQGAVWEEVACSLAAVQATSDTMALSDAYAKREKDLAEFRSRLQMPEEAVGVAVYRGKKFQGLDLFDRHSTLKYFWESLIDSYALDGLAVQVDEPVEMPKPASGKDVAKVLTQIAQGKWEAFDSPGAGQDWRLEDAKFTGSALVWEDTVVLHLQAFPRQEAGEESRRGRPRIHRPYGHGPGIVY